ncbi:MAG: GNAT family N-acetyltransferase [Chloroflexota bacterium]
MQIRHATPADLPHVRALRDAAEWKTHPWAVYEAMRAPHARFFLALDGDGVAGMGSGISYGRLGVVGNMVVAPSRRREGIGSAILGEVLGFLDERGVERVELFATPAGRPLYERHGFTGQEPGTLAEIPVAAGALLREEGHTVVHTSEPAALARLAAYDGPRFGGDRSPILAAALADPARSTIVATRVGVLVGYAVVRDEGTRLGPWLADDTRAAAALLRATLDARPPELDAPVLAMMPAENASGRAWLAGIGARLSGSDGRMARGPAVPRRLEAVYGNAVGALG